MNTVGGRERLYSSLLTVGMNTPSTRRGYLASAVSLVGVGVAGCTGSPETESPEPDETAETNRTEETDETEGTDEELDLREANVVAVEIESVDSGYRFDVTLYHDDDGEDGYANWWQVERRNGEQLGRRELAHAHGTQEFTRSATIDVPDGVETVVVRGHDQTHGYGGQAMLVTIATGETKAVQQGPDPQRFDE